MRVRRWFDRPSLSSDDVFSLLENRDYVSRFYSQLHGSTPSAGHVQELITHVLQGRPYFGAAISAAPWRARWQYYGVAALSRGLIMHRPSVVSRR